MKAGAYRPQTQASDDRGTPDAGEPAFRIAAVKILLDHLLNDRSEKPILIVSRLRTAKPVFPLETTLILRQEPVEMMRQHPIKDRSLRMSRTIASRHGGREASRNGPTSRI
jgi:hypothetical protein